MIEHSIRQFLCLYPVLYFYIIKLLNAVFTQVHLVYVTELQPALLILPTTMVFNCGSNPFNYVAELLAIVDTKY